jgi:hypothetical protein
MNKDALINRIAHTTGCSRKEVIDTLKQFGMLSGSPKHPIRKGS